MLGEIRRGLDKRFLMFSMHLDYFDANQAAFFGTILPINRATHSPTLRGNHGIPYPVSLASQQTTYHSTSLAPVTDRSR